MISVIIPVYNTNSFLRECVSSAICHDVVGEVLLIEDGSIDGSFELCIELQVKYEKVFVLNHLNNVNKGASASRNLGIISAKFQYIAFLDADDFFLSNRFDYFHSILKVNEDFDGLYEQVQYFNGSNKIYGVKKKILPEKLFHYLIRGTYGHFHTNGLIVKKDLLLSVGLFNEKLRLHQDSELWLKLAFYGRLVSGDLSSPVSMVRVHKDNRIWAGTSNSSRLKQWKVTWSWAWNKPVGFINKLLILRKIFKYSVGCLK